MRSRNSQRAAMHRLLPEIVETIKQEAKADGREVLDDDKDEPVAAPAAAAAGAGDE